MSKSWESRTISISNLISFDVQLSQYFFHQRNWPICASHYPNTPCDSFHWDWIHSGKGLFFNYVGFTLAQCQLGTFFLVCNDVIKNLN